MNDVRRRTELSLEQDNALLREQLADALEVLNAIRSGSVDALVIEGPNAPQVYTLHGADYPYRVFLEGMNEGAVTLAPDRTILYANGAFARLVDVSLEQLVGTDFRQFVPPPGQHALAELFDGTAPASGRREVRLVARDLDAEIPVQLSGQRLHTAPGSQWLCLIVTDLRDQRLREQLAQSEARVKTDLEAITSLYEAGSFCVQPGNSVEKCLEHLLDAAIGLARADMGNVQLFDPDARTLSIAVHRNFSAEFLDFFASVVPGNTTSCAAAMAHAQRVEVDEVEASDAFTDDAARMLLREGVRACVSTPLLGSTGKLLGVVNTHFAQPTRLGERELRLLDLLARQAADHLERRDAQSRLQSFASELEARVEVRTRELLQSRERLRRLAAELNLTEQRERKRLATVLHDNLAQVLVLTRLKLGQASSDHIEPAQEVLIHQADELLGEALTYTRTLVTDLAPPVLHDLGLPAALSWLGDYMRRHDLEVAVDNRDEVGLQALDEEQAVPLFQSVRELLINVAKHAGSGRARVVLERRADTLHIEVQDDGTGFDSDAFATEAALLSTRFGLLSVRERMLALGGTFEIRSEPGRGTRAILELPLVPGAQGLHDAPPLSGPEDSCVVERRNAPARVPGAPAQRASDRVRLLLVDDHTMVRQGLRALLESHADIRLVGEATNGEEAVALADELRPELIVMDISMPRMNGIEATTRIKARYPEVLVIGLSVDTGAQNQAAMLKAGAAVLISKDAVVELLYATIREQIDLHSREVPCEGAQSNFGITSSA